jgi:hypothetical protein
MGREENVETLPRRLRWDRDLDLSGSGTASCLWLIQASTTLR